MSPVMLSASCGTLQVFPPSLHQWNKSRAGGTKQTAPSASYNRWRTRFPHWGLRISAYSRSILNLVRLSLHPVPGKRKTAGPSQWFQLMPSLNQRWLAGWVRGKVLQPNNCLMKNTLTQDWLWSLLGKINNSARQRHKGRCLWKLSVAMVTWEPNLALMSNCLTPKETWQHSRASKELTLTFFFLN